MKNKRSTKALRGLTGLTSSLLVVALGTTTIANAWASKINEYLGTTNISVTGETSDSDDAYYYKSDYDNTTDLINARNDVMTKIQEEGTVLMKNDDQALPLKKSSKVTLFGMTSYAPVYGGTVGSSSPAKQDLSFKECFEDAGMEVNPTMWSFYESMSKDYKRMSLAPTWFGFTGAEMEAQTIRTGEVPVDKYTDTERASYSDYNDAAIVVIGRQGSEADDFGTSTDNVKDGDGTHLALGLQDVERDMINEAKKNFDKVIVLINSDNPMEIEELKEDKDIDSILWIGEPGTVGLKGVASVLTGEVSPSGHLPDTYAVSSVSSPAMANFGSYTFTNATEKNFGASNYSGSNYVVESEGIYTGYKYYETRYEDTVLKQGNADSEAGASGDNGSWNYDQEVSYGFGYGLSYTSFEQNIKNFDYSGDSVTLSVEVTNTGDVAGKDVVQLYAQTPYTDYDKENNVEKASVQLIGFEKTKELKPGESETVEVSAPKEYFASYDYKTAKTYIMDAGDYYFAVGNGAHEALNNILAAKGYTTADGMDADGNKDLAVSYKEDSLDTTTYAMSSVTGNAITNQFEDADLNNYQEGTVTYLSRNDWEGTWPQTYDSIEATEEMQKLIKGNSYTISKDDDTSEVKWGQDGDLHIIDLKGLDYDDEKWDQLLSQITLDEATNFIQLGGSGIEPIAYIDLIGGLDADGPNGIIDAFGGKVLSTYWKSSESDDPTYVSSKDENASYECGTFPTEPTLAATFNKELAADQGDIFAEDSLWTNITTIYAPGLNLHRTPYCGRNQEYFSEDSVLTGELGAAEILKAQDKGCILAPKHFAFNNQEVNRSGLATFGNEQALRENELRGFQISFVKGQAKGLMNAYNRIGCTWVGMSEGLSTEVVRNEWGFKGWENTDMLSSEDYQRWEEGLLAGTDLLLNTSLDSYSDLNAKTVKNDLALQKRIKESLHYTLYAYVNSNLMNGVTDSTNVDYVLTVWQKGLIGVDVLFGALTLLCLVLYIRKARKIKKEQ